MLAIPNIGPCQNAVKNLRFFIFRHAYRLELIATPVRKWVTTSVLFVSYEAKSYNLNYLIHMNRVLHVPLKSWSHEKS